jgi:hypothetical protein
MQKIENSMKNKTTAIIIAIILLSSMAITFNALSTVNATGLYPVPGHQLTVLTMLPLQQSNKA